MGKSKVYQLNYDELSGVCFQIALMLHSGILIIDGLEAMCGVRDQTAGVQRILSGIVEEMKQYTRLCDAIRKSGAFPSYMVGMVELGESTGKLEDVMRALSEHYKREERLRGMILGAVFYPSVLCVMISAVIAALVTRILPEFSRVLEDMGAGPSAFIGALISLGGAGVKVIFVFILMAFAAACGFMLYAKRSGKGFTLRDALLKLPFFSRIANKIAAGQFASAMALAISSGYKTEDAFALMGAIITNRKALAKIKYISSHIAGGGSFSQAVISSGIFDGMPERMVAVGERAGKLEEVMYEISGIYEGEASIALNNFVSTIEPVMVAFLAIVTGVIMLVIMLPLLGIISTMH